MPGVKAANLGRELRRLPTFGMQIGMTLHAELVSYSGQGLMIAAVLPVACDTVRGERFTRLMHQTSVTCGACGRCGHTPGISMALRAVMANEFVRWGHLSRGEDARSVPWCFPQRYLAQQQQHHHPAHDNAKAPPRQTALCKQTVSKAIV